MKPGHRALDIGCGRGEFFVFADAHGTSGAGIDYSAAAVDLSRTLWNSEDLAGKHHALRSNCKELPFADDDPRDLGLLVERFWLS